MSKHTKFILTPILSLVEDAVTATQSVGSTIETYPLCDYIMQTLFLKMTGFQEQKMKCICWDMATYDYEYRYRLMKSPLGECSTIDDKNTIYQELSKHIDEFGPIINTSKFKKKIIAEAKSELSTVLDSSNLIIWAQQDYNYYNTFLIYLSEKCLFQDCQDKGYKLFTNRASCSEKAKSCKCLGDIYKQLYSHRNRCAHNLLSYQQNLPTLKTLCNRDNLFNNHFIRFFVLILIDKIFIETYKIYLEQNDNFGLS